MICLILAAGYATRLYPLTENFPKPLLDVQGRTVLDWLLSDVDGIEGIGKYVVVSNHKFYDHFTAWKESCSLSHPVVVLDDGSTDNPNKPSVPVTTSTNSTGIAIRRLQGLISGEPVPCTLSTKSTTNVSGL